MRKSVRIIIVCLAVLLVLFLGVCSYFYLKFKPATSFEWGISFSPGHAQYLGFDWKTMYLDMLNDLQPKKLRLVSYWDETEPERGRYDFQTQEEMLIEAGKRDIDVIMVVGQKQPRWPECHHPAWYNALSGPERAQAQLEAVRETVLRLKKYPAIKVWQVENEALFDFGAECPVIDKELFRQEIAAVRALDNRPILLTDSGELGRWVPTAKMKPDILGPTMYRVVHNPKFGYFQYPLPPAFFRIKAGIVEQFTGVDRFLGAELQAEPWFADDMFRTDLTEQYSLMNPKIFRDNVEYARKAGFSENYLWGVEWWYWLAKKQNDWGMWNEAKTLLRNG
ncbi:MAG: hypothetical protein ACM3NH_03645 [Candidatus Saccharibacteria bacterium]